MNITCLVDDAVQTDSSFWAEHGLAFLIETEAGRVLFDTGQSGTVLLHNLESLGVDPATIDAMAISHAHHDHTGGLRQLLERVRPGIPLYAGADLFRKRFSCRDEKTRSIGLPLGREEMTERLTLKLSAEPQEIVPQLWTTGEITRRPNPEGRSSRHLVEEGGVLVPDPYRDDMALVLMFADQMLLLCGCCHAGLLNTMEHVSDAFKRPIAAIAGGLHLADATAEHLQKVGSVLGKMKSLRMVYPNHCSGQEAFTALRRSLGGSVVHHCHAGCKLELGL